LSVAFSEIRVLVGASANVELYILPSKLYRFDAKIYIVG